VNAICDGKTVSVIGSVEIITSGCDRTGTESSVEVSEVFVVYAALEVGNVAPSSTCSETVWKECVETNIADNTESKSSRHFIFRLEVTERLFEFM
jgi:hypothetical protein